MTGLSATAAAEPVVDGPTGPSLITVLYAPSATFTRLAQRPRFIAPLLLWMVLTGVLTAVLQPRLDIDSVLQRRMAARGVQLTAEQLAAASAARARFAGVNDVLAAFGPVLLSVVLATFLLLVLKTISGGSVRWVAMLSIVVHASVPLIIATGITIPVAATQQLIDPADVNNLLLSNLSFLAPDAGAFLRTILQAIDAYAIWTAVLLIFGSAIATRTSRTVSGFVIVGSWLAWIVVRAGIAAAVAS